MSRLMKPHASLTDALRELMKATPRATPPRPVLSPSACVPQPAQTRKPKSQPPPAPVVAYSSMIDGFVVTPDDLRSRDNNRPHTPARYAGPPPKSAAAASKLRRKEMEACGCRLCALALNPPQTFAEYEALGLNSVRAEFEAATERHPFTFQCANPSYCTNPNHNPKARRDADEDRGWNTRGSKPAMPEREVAR
jgi:hypothetical protein